MAESKDNIDKRLYRVITNNKAGRPNSRSGYLPSKFVTDTKCPFGPRVLTTVYSNY